MDFNEPRQDKVAVASGGPYANHLHFTPDSTSPLTLQCFETVGWVAGRASSL